MRWSFGKEQTAAGTNKWLWKKNNKLYSSEPEK
jgi:hypothetical protein